MTQSSSLTGQRRRRPLPSAPGHPVAPGADLIHAGELSGPVPGLVRFAVVVATLSSFATALQTNVDTPIGGFTVRPEQLCTVALVVAVAASPIRDRLFREAAKLPAMLFAAFVGWNVLVSVFFAPLFARSLSILGWLLLDYFLFICISGLPELRRVILRTGFIVTAVSAVLAILTYLTWLATGRHLGMVPSEVPGEYSVRLLALEPNILAALFILWGLLALFVARRATRFRVPLRLTAFLAFAASFVTDTRAATLALIAGLLLYVVTMPALHRVAAAVWAFLAAAVVFTFSFPALSGVDRFLADSSLVDFGTGTGSYRVDTWRIALDDLDLGAWLFGLGTNSFGQRHLERTLQDGTPGYLGNLPLQVLYDSGIVGVLLLAGVVAAILVRVNRRRLDLAAALLVAFLITATATSSLWFSFVWIFASLGCMPPAIAAAHEQPASPTRPLRPTLLRGRGIHQW